MTAVSSHEGANAGAHRLDAEAIRRHQFEIGCQRALMRRASVSYVREWAFVLRRLLHGIGDRACICAVDQALAAMRRDPENRNHHAARHIGRACEHLTRVIDSLPPDDGRRSMLAWHVDWLRTTRRYAGDIVHAEVMARLAASMPRPKT